MQPDGRVRTVSIVLNARVYRVAGRYFGDLPNLLDLLLEVQRLVGRLVLCVPVVEATEPPRWTHALPPEIEIVPLPGYEGNVTLIRQSHRLIPDLIRRVLPRITEWDAVGGVAPSGFGLLTVLVALARRRRAFLLVRGNVILSLWGEHRTSLARRLAVTGALLPFEALSRLLIRMGVPTFTFGPALAERYRGRRVCVLGGYARPSVVKPYPPTAVTDAGLLRRLLYVGRLTGEKGPDVLIRAVARLRERGRDVALTMVGDGAERDALGALAEELGVAEHVTFIHYIRESDSLREQYLGTGVVVIPSRTEGVPGVLLEAMALGRVVVASRVGGIPSQVVSGESGLLVPPNDPASLADAIELLLDDPDQAFRLAARAAAIGQERTVEREASTIVRGVFGV